MGRRGQRPDDLPRRATHARLALCCGTPEVPVPPAATSTRRRPKAEKPEPEKTRRTAESTNLSRAVHGPATVARHRGAMFTALPRPAKPHETLRGPYGVDAPMIALFENEHTARLAVLNLTEARVLRHPRPGVRMLAPAPGLRETLYAAGALLVVG
jgi:hypothetical protein